MQEQLLRIHNARVHNLKSISIELPHNKLICFTGVSGSGKSSLAFDTIFIEGQRRYIESLPQHIQKFLHNTPRPDVDSIAGIGPTIAIEQKTAAKNPRSTVATLTEIYDYFRVLYARVATPYCPISKEPVEERSPEEIIDQILSEPEETKIVLLAPYERNKKGSLKDDLDAINKKGFTRVRIDKELIHIDNYEEVDTKVTHDIDIVIDRCIVKKDQRARIEESVRQALEIGNGTLLLLIDEREELLSTKAYSKTSGISYPPLTPQDFSFNSPFGMCEQCHGMGICHIFCLEKIIDPEKSIAEDCCCIASSATTVRYGNIYANLATMYDFSLNTPWKNLSKKAQDAFLYGTTKKWVRMRFVHPKTGAVWYDTIRFQGVLHEAWLRYQEATSESYKTKMHAFMELSECPSCMGERLKSYPRAAQLGKKRLPELVSMSISESLDFFQNLTLNEHKQKIAQDLIKEIIARLLFLYDVGLSYLELSRRAPTLSGGEAQRVRLASQIGSGLSGITYVLDEPSIGLHPQDNKKLITSLQKLRDKGNSIIVVEHDEEMIRSSDMLVDFGPRAGTLGGKILFQGTLKDLKKCSESLTSDYLFGRKTISLENQRRSCTDKKLRIEGVTHNNLQNITLEIPLSTFVAITGVSGSGKSSLLLDTLYPAINNQLLKTKESCGNYTGLFGLEHIDKVIEIDQTPIGKTPRSNPATYTKLFDAIRALFAQLPESVVRGYSVGRFSFNTKEGTCRQCQGMGFICINMDFLEPSWILCSSCNGRRFDRETLSIRFKGKTIFDVLEMDVREAFSFFEDIPQIFRILKTLMDVGLDYIKLGQPATTLSGGEAQRIKLAKELSRPQTGKTLYILDEPTTGLHFHDIQHLLNVLHQLVDKQNSVVVIEHNMDVVKTADWVIEVGPGSGKNGGKIVAAGTPEAIIATECATSDPLKEAMYPTWSLQENKNLISVSKESSIAIKGAEQHNLKNLSVSIPRNQYTVCVGPSGSGKSSFALDTVFVEGQRRYIESLPPYVRQFIKQMPKPLLDSIEGIPPTIALEQSSSTNNPRSTVGTSSEIYDYLRILWSRIGIPHCPITGKKIEAISKEHVVKMILSWPENERIYIMAPLALHKEKFPVLLNTLKREGFVRIRLNGIFYELDDEIPFQPKKQNNCFLVIDRAIATPEMELRLLEAITTAAFRGNNQIVIYRETTPPQDITINLSFSVPETGISYPEITPKTFAFNTKQGMCPECQGLGFIWGIDMTKLDFIEKFSPIELCKQLWNYPTKELLSITTALFSALGIDPKKKIKELDQDARRIVFHGSTKNIPITYKTHTIEWNWKGLHQAVEDMMSGILKKKDQDAPPISEKWLSGLEQHICASCQGGRINPLARAVTINNCSINAFCELPITQALNFMQDVALQEDDISLFHTQKEILSRLSFLQSIGLGYITLSRASGSLSNGETQRVRLARQLGANVTGVLYVLDEPSLGLHARDIALLKNSFDNLKNQHNTLLIIEHNPEIIKNADYVLEFGPGSGYKGGSIIHKGTFKEFIKSKHSPTGDYIKKCLSVPREKKEKKPSYISIKNASLHNLKNVHVDFPLGCFTCITGVSGAGKSTLMQDILYTALFKALREKKEYIETKECTLFLEKPVNAVFLIDQRPIGMTARSDLTTYFDISTPLRSFFASLPEAKMRGLQPKNFSPYHRKGLCTSCYGLGYNKVSLHFLPDVIVACQTCKGLRLNAQSLSITYKGKNLGELLQKNAEELTSFFSEHPQIMKKLTTLIALGLEYIPLSQEMRTLSHGEIQRIKLAKEVVKRAKKSSLYLFDEPTSGAHGKEIEKILFSIEQLLHQGQTVIAISHNLDFIAHADHVIELGPEAGVDGGEVIFTGTPEELSKAKKTTTGPFLRKRITQK